jgi:hypothetical protein
VLFRYTFRLISSTIWLILLVSASGFAAEPKAAEDPEALLQRIRNRMTAHLSQLPNYTCHEVVTRLHRLVSGTWDRRDRVEVEVAFVDNRELFSRLGEARFEDQPLNKIVTDGAVATGAFGSHLEALFAEEGASFKYIGPHKKEGHTTFRYDFRVPLEKSHFLVGHNSKEGMVPFQGSFWVDIETLDLVRLEVKINHIAPYIGIRSVEEQIHYKILRLKNSEFLLPRNSELGVTDESGNYSLNMTTLQDCKEFTGKSIVTYDKATGGENRRPDH